MLFNSLHFLIFFPVVFFLYWALPVRLRPYLLLLASSYFYMAFVPYYIFILFALITVTYLLARLIEESVGRKRLFYLSLSIGTSIGMLFVFKYFNFFNANLEVLASFLHWNYSLKALSLVLPLGLSFHTFQVLAYTIEVYKSRYPAEKKYLPYALYVMFFPQLVAGPIERPAHLLPQLKAVHVFNYADVVSGLQLMLWGFFKKIVIATPLAILVDFVYGHAAQADSSAILLAVIAFYFLLYADFSGYTDIALGAARMFGINLVQNFRLPYLSRSTSDLWRRWHISLSSWFRDYVYYPLAWNTGTSGQWGIAIATMSTFTLMGIWHGAGWNYLFMGVIFGFYICFGMWSKPWRDKISHAVDLDAVPIIKTAIQIITTFCLTAVAWVFFRTTNLHQAFLVLSGLFAKWGVDAFSYLTCSSYCSFYILGISKKELAIIAVSIAGMIAYEYLHDAKISFPAWLNRRPLRWSLYYTFILWILFSGYFVSKTFIYFQF